MIEGLDAAEFYRLRDDRTNRVTPSRDYHSLRVRLIAGPMTVQNFAGQVQLLTSANLLARWCRQLEFGFPDASLAQLLQVQGYKTLHQRIRAEVDQANPFGHFVFKAERSGSVQYTLKVGSDNLAEPVDFTIDASGWEVWAGQGNCVFDLPHPPNNPIGPAFTACLGVADAFKVAIGLPGANRIRRLAWSLFDFCHLDTKKSTLSPQMPTTLALGNVQIVGIGSVGSSVIYLLAMLTLEGSILIIDHDIVKIENLNRSPLFGIAAVSQPKVTVAAHYLQSFVSVEAFAGRYGEFIRQHGRKPGDVDLILPLANEFGVRPNIENNFPPLQIYGTTTPDWGVNYHRHIPFQEDCSVCRFPSEVQPNFVCSTAQVETEQNEQVDAALPFLSMAAAILIVADLLKLQLPGYPFTSNFAFIDFKGGLEPPYPLVYQRHRRVGCICAERSPHIYRRYLASTRFSELSPMTDEQEKKYEQANPQHLTG